MSATTLDTPFVDGGLHLTNFFNGRILSREDMAREQEAARVIDQRLGRAIGDGVASGFEVEAKAIGGSSIDDPVVTVHAGLAINRLGQTVALDRDVDVSLKKPTAIESSGTALSGSFDDCQPAEEGAYVVGTGVYLLAVAPAQVKQGLALVSGLNNGTATCNVKEVVQGVQFRLFQVTGLSSAELADEDRLRNVAAYKFFFASGAGAGSVRDPFGVAPAAQQLTDVPLSDCDVPLALLHWTNTGGLRWVDLWSVRRPLRGTAQAPSTALFQRDARVGPAMILQFQAQITDLRLTLDAAFKASDAFMYLPPLGMIPVQGAVGALDLDSFFSGLKRRSVPAFIESARLAALIEDAGRYPPIDPAMQETIWTYFVHENMRSADTGASGAGAQPYLVFTNGQISYRADARFDLAYWGYANYALR